MHCVYQKNHTDKREIVITMIKFPENFISTIQGILDETYKIVHVYVESLNDGLIDGHYLYMDGNKLILIKKSTITKQGYVYNSTVTVTEKIYTWKLLCFEIPISCETKEEVIETIETPVEAIIEKVTETVIEDSVPEKNIEINAILEDLPQIQFDLDEICKSLETIHITWTPECQALCNDAITGLF